MELVLDRRGLRKPSLSQQRDELVGQAGERARAVDDLVDVPAGVVVGPDRLRQARLGAGGVQVARGGEDRVDRVPRVALAVAVGVDAVALPRRWHELHPADRAGARLAQVARRTPVSTSLIAARICQWISVLRAGGLVDRQQERRDRELRDRDLREVIEPERIGHRPVHRQARSTATDAADATWARRHCVLCFAAWCLAAACLRGRFGGSGLLGGLRGRIGDLRLRRGSAGASGAAVVGGARLVGCARCPSSRPVVGGGARSSSRSCVVGGGSAGHGTTASAGTVVGSSAVTDVAVLIGRADRRGRVGRDDRPANRPRRRRSESCRRRRR